MLYKWVSTCVSVYTTPRPSIHVQGKRQKVYPSLYYTLFGTGSLLFTAIPPSLQAHKHLRTLLSAYPISPQEPWDCRYALLGLALWGFWGSELWVQVIFLAWQILYQDTVSSSSPSVTFCFLFCCVKDNAQNLYTDLSTLSLSCISCLACLSFFEWDRTM